MKPSRTTILTVLIFLVIAAGAYLWATNLMSSLYAFRSPLQNDLPVESQVMGDPLVRRVVSIMVDGLRVDTASDPDVMPFLNYLRKQGAWAVVHSGLPSYSVPSWSVLATGAWQDLSDAPAMNPPNLNEAWLWTRDSIYTSAHRAGLRTAVAANDWFSYLIPPGDLDASFYTSDLTTEADQQNVNKAIEYIKSGEYEYIFTYMTMVDHEGHLHGGDSPEYRAAASTVDEQIRQVVEALDLNQDVVMVYSDHGHLNAGGHGGQEEVVTTQPFVLAGAEINPGVYSDIQQVDIAPTTAALLGSPLPTFSQGHARTEMLYLPYPYLAGLQNAYSAQQENLYIAYAKAMGVEPQHYNVPAGLYNQYLTDGWQPYMQQIKNARLWRERLPRFALVLLIVVPPLWLVIKRRTRLLIWVGLGILVYLLVFNLHYILFQHGSYTLSSVTSSGELIAGAAVGSLLALLAGWLAAAFGMKLFQMDRSEAAHLQIVFSALLLYVIALPALFSFGWNGLLVTWTIPDVGSMYLGFLHTLQLIFVAAAAPLLLGATALLAGRN